MTKLEELKREKELIEVKIKRLENGRPIHKDMMDFVSIYEFTEENIDNIVETGRPLKDFEHCLYEVVIEAIYGKDYWNWYREIVV